MEDFNLSEWNKYGCGSRCLLNLRNYYATLQDSPLMSPQEFCRKFGEHFPENHFGALYTSALIDVARTMGICGIATTHVDLDKTRNIFAKKDYSAILISSEWNEQHGEYSEINHWQLMAGFLPNGEWEVWHPNIDGRDFHTFYTDQEMQKRKVHFVVFYPPRAKTRE